MRTLYGIADRVAGEMVGHSMYIHFAFRTDQQAVRYFADAILDPKSVLNQHPADYELQKIADLDETGHTTKVYHNCVILTGDALIAATTEHQPKLVKES